MISKSSTATDCKPVLKTCFLTIDAETELIREGVQTISDIRKGVEKELGVYIPIIWFVRFQHSWRTTLNYADPSHIEGDYKDIFDGFGLFYYRDSLGNSSLSRESRNSGYCFYFFVVIAVFE